MDRHHQRVIGAASPQPAVRSAPGPALSPSLERWKLARRRLRAQVLKWRYRQELSALRHYVLFLGYPRSGHTLVASLLDAHPDMLFANGLDAARYVQFGFGVREIAALSIWNSMRFTRHGRRSNGFEYTVNGGLHGGWEKLEVIGDKSGDLFSYRLLDDSALLHEVLDQFSGLGRFIHVIRNPFDCISTMAMRAGIELRAAADEFLALCEANRQAREAIPANAWKDLRLEQLIEQPRLALRELCEFLGVKADDRYLGQCAKLVFPSPHESRRTVDWPASLVAEVSMRIRALPWLDGYRF